MKTIVFTMGFIALISTSWSAEALSEVSFDAALKQMVERNTAVQIAQRDRNATHSRNRAAGLHFLPEIEIQASHDTSKRLGAQSASDVQTAQATADLPLYRFGADVAKLDSAEAGNRAADLDLQDTTLAAENTSLKLLVDYIAARKETAIYAEKVRMRKLAVAIATKRYKRGLLSKQEVDKMRVDLQNDHVRLDDQTIDEAETTARLTEQLGHNNVTLEWTWIPKFEEATLKETIEKAEIAQLQAHPAWQSAESKVKQAQADLDQSFRSLLPSLNLTGTAGYQRNPDLNIDGDIYSVGLTLRIPLFNRLQDYGNYQARVQTKMKAELQLERTKRDLRGRLTGVKKALTTALASAKQREETMAISKKLYQVNLRRFRKGLINANDLMVDLDRLFNSELFATRGWAQAHKKYADLHYALGKPLLP